jgi:hypothetical protein
MISPVKHVIYTNINEKQQMHISVLNLFCGAQLQIFGYIHSKRINIIEWNNTIYSNQLTIFVFNGLKKGVGSKHTNQ